MKEKKKKSKLVEMEDIFYDEVTKKSSKITQDTPLTDKLKKKLRKEMEEARKGHR